MKNSKNYLRKRDSDIKSKPIRNYFYNRESTHTAVDSFFITQHLINIGKLYEQFLKIGKILEQSTF